MLYCGAVPAAHYTSGGFEARVCKVIQHRQQAREAGVKGFQRTPAFVHTVILDVLDGVDLVPEEEREYRQPKGGFTDVGQHTGSQPRDTAWPLVRETAAVS